MNIKPALNLVSDRLHALPLVVLYLTDGCNSRCVMCDIWRSPRRNMPLDMAERIADECADLGLRWLVLSGGEAMQHPHWPQIAAMFRQRGVHVMLLTNGLLLQKQAAEVIASVDEVIVSLDGGTAEVYHAIRGVDAFDLVLEGMQAVSKGGVPVSTRTTVQRANFRQLSQIVDAALAHGAARVSFLAVDVANPVAFGPRFVGDPSLAVTGGSALPNPAALTAEDIAELSLILDDMTVRHAPHFAAGTIAESPAKLRRVLVDYFRAVAGLGPYPRPRCNAPHFSAVIEVDGTVRPCYFLPAVGRLNGASIRETINGDAAAALRQAYRAGQRSECERCVCPLYKGPRALMRM
jgi:MoaA/NifB/PqqE/SkfB family radical SAM enzyme